MIRVQLILGVILPGVTIVTACVGCQQRPEMSRATTTTARAHLKPPPNIPATAPSTGLSSETSSADTPPETRPDAPKPPPKRISLRWAVFLDAFETKSDAAVQGRWTGGNRVELETKNVRRLIIDLTELPAGAPKHGPWNLQIDGQGIEITGRRGPRIEMTRGDAGAWNVTGPKRPVR